MNHQSKSVIENHKTDKNTSATIISKYVKNKGVNKIKLSRSKKGRHLASEIDYADSQSIISQLGSASNIRSQIRYSKRNSLTLANLDKLDKQNSVSKNRNKSTNRSQHEYNSQFGVNSRNDRNEALPNISRSQIYQKSVSRIQELPDTESEKLEQNCQDVLCENCKARLEKYETKFFDKISSLVGDKFDGSEEKAKQFRICFKCIYLKYFSEQVQDRVTDKENTEQEIAIKELIKSKMNGEISDNKLILPDLKHQGRLSFNRRTNSISFPKSKQNQNYSLLISNKIKQKTEIFPKMSTEEEGMVMMTTSREAYCPKQLEEENIVNPLKRKRTDFSLYVDAYFAQGVFTSFLA